MAISNGVIFIWTGTNANIPAGWERVTALDSKYPKAVANTSTEPNTTGGSATHTHTSPAHSHTLQNHTHTITISGISSGAGNAGDSRENATDHTGHAPFTSGAVSGGGLSSVTSTYASVSNDPPYYEVIYITPTTAVGGLPNLALALSEDTGFTNNTGKYNGYYLCDGTNSTPTLANKYLKGAGTGADAGGTGGSTTNVHTLTHTHSVSLHTHVAATSGAANGFSQRDEPGSGFVRHDHTHQVALLAPASDPISAEDIVLTTTETVEPAYKKLLAIQNRSGTVYTPTDIIGLWLGTIADIPTNFEIISTLNDKHLKIASNTGEISNTGGSNTHTHSAQDHTHTAAGTHTHTANGLEHVSGTSVSGSDNSATRDSQVHTQPTVTNETSVYNTATTTAESSSNEPEYRTVAFIKYKGEKGASILLNLI